MTRKILIFGSAGMLGRELIDYFSRFPKYKVIAVDKKEADIASFDSVFKILKKHKPDFVINCAALINVEYCQSHPLEAYEVNSMGPGNIVRALASLNSRRTKFIQISTSDVFGGKKNFFKEDDKPNPVNVYGWSKFWGEKIIEQECKTNSIDYFIIRTSWLYSKYKKTFVDFIYENLRDKKQIKVISDQFGVVTWAKDLAKYIGNFVKNSEKHESGIYHLVSSFDKRLSRLDIAREIAKIADAESKPLKRSKMARVFKVPRPKSAVLINSKLPKMPNWKKSLKRYLLSL